MLGTDIIAWYGWLLLIGFAYLQVVLVCSWSCGAMLGTDIIGCCLLDSLPFKLSSFVHGVSGQCLVRSSSWCFDVLLDHHAVGG